MDDCEETYGAGSSSVESCHSSDTAGYPKSSFQAGSQRQTDDKTEVKPEQNSDEDQYIVKEEEEDSLSYTHEVVHQVQSPKESNEVNENNQIISKEQDMISIPESINQTESPANENVSPTRLVSDAVPMMSANDNDLNVITERMDRVTSPKKTSSYSPQPIKLQNYPNVQNPNSKIAYNTYQPTNNPINKPRLEAVSVWASGTLNAPVQQPLNITPMPYSTSARSPLTSSSWRSADSDEQPSEIPKYSAGSMTYIGSRVIAAETGPSLTIQLRRPTSEKQWGFTFHGGAEYGCPPFVNKVSNHGLAMSYGLEVADVLVSICDALTVGKTQDQLKAEILRSGNELDLIIIRRGVDIEKIAQLVPQVIPTSPRSPLSTSPLSSRENSTICVFDDLRLGSTHSPNTAQPYRVIKTRAMQILENQLNSAQATSALATKQHFQGARGLPSHGAGSSFIKAYGENSSQGYTGRMANLTGNPGGDTKERFICPEKTNAQRQAPPYGQLTDSQLYGQSINSRSYGPQQNIAYTGQPNYPKYPIPTLSNPHAGECARLTRSNLNKGDANDEHFTSTTTVNISKGRRQQHGYQLHR